MRGKGLQRNMAPAVQHLALRIRSPHSSHLTPHCLTPHASRLTAVAMALFVFATATACVRWSRSQPAWVDGTSQDYSSQHYLLGLGQADAQPAAAERAYAAVAKVFKAQVNVQSRDWESFLLLENRGKPSTERRLTLDQVTRVSTDKVLENVRILDTWYNRRTGIHYALAGMNRAQAEAAMLERIGELDAMIETEIQEARRTTDKLARVKNLRRAIKNLVLREAYNTDLRIIRTSGKGVEAAYRVAELTAELEQFLASNLVTGVEVTGEQAEPIRRAVIEGLIREGLPVTARKLGDAGASSGQDAAKSPELLARGTVRLWEADVPDRQFRYVRWCSDFVIVEVATQRVVGAVARSGKEGHLTVDEAMAKAVRVMQQELTSDLARTVAGYVYGETEPAVNVPAAACPRAEAPRPQSWLNPLLWGEGRGEGRMS